MRRDQQRLRTPCSTSVSRPGSSRARPPPEDALRRLAEEIDRSAEVRAKRLANLPKPTFPEALPVVQRRDEIARAIAENQVVVLCGETGSGKTTQLPKICLELGRGVAGMIGHTQPRRIAARTVAARIAEELNSPLGHAVGYKVRFTDHARPETLRQADDRRHPARRDAGRPVPRRSTTRSSSTRPTSAASTSTSCSATSSSSCPSRPDLKLIITSATIDPQRFSKHFDDCADDRGLGPDLPRRGPLPAARIATTRRTKTCELEEAILARGRRAVARAAPATSWSSSPASARSARPPRRSASTTRRASRSCRCTRGSSARRADAGLPAARPAADRAGDQRRRDVADRARHPVRDRPRLRPHQPLQRRARKVQRLPIEPISPGQRRPAQGPLRPRQRRASASGSIREEDFASRAAVHRPGDPAHEPRQRHPADEGAAAGRRSRTSRSSSRRTTGRSATATRRCTSWARSTSSNELTPHRPAARPAADRPAHRPDGPGGARRGLPGRGADHRRGADASRTRASGRWTSSEAADEAHAQVPRRDSRLPRLPEALGLSTTSRRKHLSTSKLRKLCQANFLSFVRMREWHDVHHQLKELVSEMGLYRPPTPVGDPAPTSREVREPRPPAAATRPHGAVLPPKARSAPGG